MSSKLSTTVRGPKRRLSARRGWLAATSALVGSLTLAIGHGAQALPTGGVVVGGTATVARAPGSLTVTQSTQNAAINWQGFNIGTGESVQFVQPNAQSVALNRVLGSDPSTILGRLSANGQVFLVNPNGVLFGAGSQVNVGGLVASTADIKTADLMAGRYHFSGAGPGAVVNRGSIVADGGSVALLGATVSNQGVISARLGSVTLAAGGGMTLDVAGDGLLNVTVDQGAVNALAENGGLIQADGGRVMMTAHSANALLRTAVNNTGVIEARSLQNHNGAITLLGGDVRVSGALDASGAAAGQSGGRIVATGATVILADHARLDASGQAGGGAVLVGGDYQGKNPDIANAQSLDMGADVRVAADALGAGDGGKVVLWSDGQTRVAGTISARGGAQAGHGGFVETSGHTVSANGLTVTTLAPHGKTGLWLLDPVNYTVAASGGDETGAQVGLSLAASDRVITASHDIVVSDIISWSASTTLFLTAGNDVTISSAINATGADSGLVVVAGHDATASGPITDSSTNALLRFTAGHTLTVSGAMTASEVGALIDLNAGGDIIQSAPVIASAPGFPGAGSASVIMRADSDGTGGLAGGTLVHTAQITANNLSIFYSPENGYAAPNNYLVGGLVAATNYASKMWVFVGAADKVYDANTAATLAFRGGDPTVGGTVAVALTGTGAFADPNVGSNKTVNVSGGALTGGGATAYSLFAAAGATTASITPASLTITADSASKNFGQVMTLPGSAFTSVGLVGGETVGAVTLASAGLPASATVAGSPYTITASNAVGGTFSAGNYAINYITGLLTVAPATLTITADSTSKVYGSVVTFSPTAFTVTGLLNGETVGSVTETSAGAGATAGVIGGPYAINISGATGGTFIAANYTLSYVAGVLTVTPASLVVTATSLTKPYGSAFAFTGGEFSTTGLVNGETATLVTLTSDGSSGASLPSSTPYAIRASNVTGGTFTPSNYAITYVDGGMTVQAPSSITSAGGAAATEVAYFTGGRSASGGYFGTTAGSATETYTDVSYTAGGAGVTAPAGLQLAVVGEGVRMPARQETSSRFAQQEAADRTAQANQVVQANQDTRANQTVLQAAPAPAYVAPRRARKQDRN